ncbi:ABC transporter permease [Geoalkalibacter halelectricus]|uniref:ABC transporter permease n=1 Tax=Geoalkalibacter halelectricus TaxID=2847045 RepID=UPI00266EAD26|nr:iron ABC transporter permease [Geoalkalibacter halelectricus]MDO3378942.1 iron ABC transporter permease [Geoalkalibacter halelectricus]
MSDNKVSPTSIGPRRAPVKGVRTGPFQLRFWDGWRLFTLAVALLVLVSLGVVCFSWLTPPAEIWQHLRQTLLARLLLNTLWLVLGVGVLTLVLGVSLAWLTATCEFPGRRFFSWSLLLPLAMPTYVLAFVFVGLLDFAGPVQTLWREWFGRAAWFPPIRSTPGVIIVMSLALYPYVYLLAKNAFQTQGRRAMEAAESLGCGSWEGFFRVALPMARPWIAGGVLLALMEALADFGAVSIFNYETFTTAIYKAWFGFFSLTTAAQLASLLVLLVFILIVVEQRLRARRRFSTARSSAHITRLTLRGWRAWAAAGFAGAVLLIAFGIPVFQLGVWTLSSFAAEFNVRYFALLVRSVALGLGAAVLICSTALVLSYAARRHSDTFTHGLVRVANLGYALPGAVLAVGIFIPMAALDNLLINFGETLFGWRLRPLLQGTVIIMLLAYLVRFLAPGFKPVDGAMHRVTPSIDEAARLSGLRGVALLGRIHLPMLRGGLLTAATIVFVDVMKEMPITLMTRPFGWETLAVKIFELTAEGEWERAALPAVALVVAGLVPIILFMRHSER